MREQVSFPAVQVRRTQISGDTPKVCVPLVGTTVEELKAEVETIFAGPAPDMIEWRVDFFQAIGNVSDVCDTLHSIRDWIGERPLIFTFRSVKEGGQHVELNEAEIFELLQQVIATGQIDLLDFELFHDPQEIRELRERTKAEGVKLILSYHHFSATPDSSVLQEKLQQAESAGADFAKLAVMPETKADVLTLLDVTEVAGRELSIPVITMAMGGYGSLSRMFGWVFGSAVTFAAGRQRSAPGQMSVDDLKMVIDTVKRSLNT